MKGIKIIEKAISSFTKTILSLEKGIKQCKETVSANEIVMKELGSENVSLMEASEKAEKIIGNLKTLLGE